MSSVLEFPGCRQHYKGRHSLVRQPMSQMSEQGSENSDGRWCQALMADESVPTGLRTCSGTLVCSRGQGSFLPCIVVGGYIRLHPPLPPPRVFPSVLCSFFPSFPSSHKTISCLLSWTLVPYPFVLFYCHSPFHFSTPPQATILMCLMCLFLL